jgi:hypothetical protein
MRQQHQSWQEITDHLATLGLKTDKGSLCAFFKRHRARSAPLGMEREPAPRRIDQSTAVMPPEKPDLPEMPAPPSEFEVDPLTISTKKRWGIITKTKT